MQSKSLFAMIVLFGLLLLAPPPGGAEDVSFYAEQELEKGWQAFNQGDLAAAVRSFRQAAVINPQYAPAYYAQGHADLAQNRLGAAIANFRKAIDLADPPMVEAYINLGFALTLSGRDQEGLQMYNQALALDPMNKDLQLNLSNYYCSQLNAEKAWEHIRFARKMGAEISEEQLEEMRSLCPDEE
ncbi:MAG: tetratricopeptide repeat protein [Desulfobulbales bacterium]|nr:tetratricopeptide repeat protein [Desulfobulbales bacterium]